MVENREERVRVDAKLTFSSDGCSIELLIEDSWVLQVARLMGFAGG